MTTSKSDYDLLVVGAGPAGLAAATRAAKAGIRVALIDSGRTPGGQYWRQPADAAITATLRRDGSADPTYRDLVASMERCLTSGFLHFWSEHQVWTIERLSEGFAIHAVMAGGTTAESNEAPERTFVGTSVVLAPGAYDRQIPFPGWTLPGVLTAGGAQALLKGHGVVAGKRVIVAGTGPFLLPVAAGLARSGARVLGVYEASSPRRWFRHLPTVARNAAKLAEGISYARILAAHRVPIRTSAVVVAAHGTSELDSVTVGRVDSAGGLVPGTTVQLEVDSLAVGWGFTPQLELPLALRCTTRVDIDGSVVCDVDDQQETSVPGAYVAGEASGVGGATLAVLEGYIAADAIVGANPDRRLYRRRTALRNFAAAMHQAHPAPDGWQARLASDTVVCRCEEVTVERLRAAVDAGDVSDARSAKLATRTGMGWCQGRVCGYAAACLTSQWSGSPFDPSVVAARPVAAPVRLGALARSAEET